VNGCDEMPAARTKYDVSAHGLLIPLLNELCVLSPCCDGRVVPEPSAARFRREKRGDESGEERKTLNPNVDPILSTGYRPTERRVVSYASSA